MGEEAVEKDIIAETPEIKKPKGEVKRNSTGKRVSQGSESPSTRDEKPLPHYLTASSNSCHELCKHGTKHVFEAKERRPNIPRFSSNKAKINEEQHQVKSLPVGERRKRPVIKLRTKSQRRLEFSDKAKVVKKNHRSLANESKSINEPANPTIATSLVSGDSNFGTDEQAVLQGAFDDVTVDLSPSQDQIASDEEAVSQDTVDIGVKDKQTTAKSMNPGDKKKKQVSRPKTTPLPKNSNKKTNVVQRKVSVQKDDAPNDTSSFRKPDNIEIRTALPDMEALGSAKSKVTRPNNLPSVKTSPASVKPQIIKEKGLSPPKKVDASEKPAILLKKRSSLNPTVDLIGRKDLEKDQNSKVDSASLERRKVDASAKLAISLRRKVSIGRSSSLRSANMDLLGRGNKENNIIEDVGVSKPVQKEEGKPLPPLPPKIPTEGVQSMKPKKSFAKFASTVKSLAKVGKALRGMDKTKESESKASKSEDKRKLRKTTSVRRDDKPSNPYKLNFRKGKVVDTQSENSGPKILRFRKAKEVSKNTTSTGVLWRRSFSRKRGPSDGIIKDPNTGAQVIVLRHQDVQEKKDVQILFNNVIEETAEQLVKTRKSKVKALVGAFETVISLQESKLASAL